MCQPETWYHCLSSHSCYLLQHVFVPSHCQDFWASYSCLIKSKLQSYHVLCYFVSHHCPAYSDARLMRQRTLCVVLLSSSQQTPSLGSPETYPGRDVRADTNGGSTTLGHPMWKRLQEIIPWDILPVIRWDQQKDRGLCLCYHALSISYFGCAVSAFLHDLIWLSCSSLSMWFYLIAKSTFDLDASPLSIFSWSLLPSGLHGLRFGFTWGSNWLYF